MLSYRSKKFFFFSYDLTVELHIALLFLRTPQETYSTDYPFLGEGLTKWIGDGKLLDTKKNIQLSLGNNLPLSNDMTFILVFSM